MIEQFRELPEMPYDKFRIQNLVRLKETLDNGCVMRRTHNILKQERFMAGENLQVEVLKQI